jgi:hypothetical protein
MTSSSRNYLNKYLSIAQDDAEVSERTNAVFENCQSLHYYQSLWDVI